MKKIVLILFAAFFYTVNAQKNFYLGPMLGYHFGVGKSNVSGFYNVNNSVEETSTFSLGGGFGGGLNLGYLLSDYIGIEVGASYFKSNKESFYYYENQNNVNSKLDIDLQMTSIRFTPAILLNLALEPINPYAKFGAQIALNTLTQNNVINEENPFVGGNNVANLTYEITGGISLGLYSAVGVSFAVSPSINLFSELQFQTSVYTPEKAKATEYKLNGVDVLGNLPTIRKEIEFVSRLDQSATQNPDLPFQTIKISFPTSSVGLVMGSRIFF